MNISIVSYIYNKNTNHWTDLSQDFPCPVPINLLKFSCAYLRPSKSLIMSVGICNPILNLSLYPVSWSWTSITAPVYGGIVFNVDEFEESVIFIGNNRNRTQSDIYIVRQR